MSGQAGKSPGRREVKAAVALQQPPPPQGALPLAPAPRREAGGDRGLVEADIPDFIVRSRSTPESEG